MFWFSSRYIKHRSPRLEIFLTWGFLLHIESGTQKRGLRPQGAQRRRGGTPPPALSGEASTAATNKPCERIRLSVPNPACASAAPPRPIRNPTQNCTNQAQPRHRKPPPSCSELQYGGGFTYAPLRAHPQTANQPATGWRASRGGTSYASRVGFT